MNPLKFEKSKVIERLKENRDAHRELVEKALDGYQLQVIEELERQLQKARDCKDVDPQFLARYPVPTDHTNDFDVVIDQMESSKDSEVVLSDSEFRMYMRNEWNWMDRFIATSSQYVS